MKARISNQQLKTKTVPNTKLSKSDSEPQFFLAIFKEFGTTYEWF